MIDKFLIELRLKELEKFYNTLKSMQQYTIEDLSGDLAKQWAVEHGLQLSIQLVLDVGNHILAGIGITNVEEYRDIIRKLGSEGVISGDFAASIMGMAGFRNLMVHEYMNIDLNIVYGMLKNHTDDFRTFAEQVKKYIEENA